MTAAARDAAIATPAESPYDTDVRENA